MHHPPYPPSFVPAIPAIPAFVPAFIPSSAYIELLTVRSFEVARSGYPQPGAILRYLEYLATRASGSLGYTNEWYAQQGSAWLVREMSLRFGWLPPMDSEIAMATWVAEFRRVQAFREYAIWHPASRRLIARARARWAYVHRHTGQPLRVPAEMAAQFDAPASAMRVALATDRSGHPGAAPLWRHQQTLTAREYEADVHQHVNNCVYGDWLFEGVGATLRSDNRAIADLRPRLLELEYLRQVRPGDEVHMATAIAPGGSRRLLAEQTLSEATTGELILRGHTSYLVDQHWLADVVSTRR